MNNHLNAKVLLLWFVTVVVLSNQYALASSVFADACQVNLSLLPRKIADSIIEVGTKNKLSIISRLDQACSSNRTTLIKINPTFVYEGILRDIIGNTVSIFFPLRLLPEDYVSTTKILYPKGVFGTYNMSDFLFLNSIVLERTTALSTSTKDRRHSLSCLAGAHRAKIVNDTSESITLGAEDTKFLGNEVIQGILRSNRKLFPKISSVSIPIKLETQKCIKVIRDFFPLGMFHTFSPIESLFMTHLSPQNSLMDLIHGTSEDDADFFTECFIGASRTNVIRDFNMVSSNKEALMQTLRSYESQTLLKKELPIDDEDSPEGGILLSKVIRAEYESQMSKSVGAVTALPLAVKTALTVLIAKLEKYDSSLKGIQLSTEHALSILSYIAPEGMFHIFRDEESLLVNMLYPLETGLVPDVKKQFWMECLMGSIRSLSIRDGIKDPWPYLKPYIEKSGIHPVQKLKGD